MRWKSSLQDVRVRRGGDVWSHYYMLAGKLHLKLKRMSAKQPECLLAVESLGDAFIFIYLGFNVAFNTVQVISRRVVGRAEETST